MSKENGSYTELILIDTDLERLWTSMKDESFILESAILEAIRRGEDTFPVIAGWERGQYELYWEFCFCIPTEKRIADAMQWDNLEKAEAEKSAAIDEYIDASFSRSLHMPAWRYMPKDDMGILRNRVVPLWLTANDYTIGQVKMKSFRMHGNEMFDSFLHTALDSFQVLTEPSQSQHDVSQATIPNANPSDIPQSLDELKMAISGHKSRTRHWQTTVGTWWLLKGQNEIGQEDLAEELGVSRSTITRAVRQSKSDASDAGLTQK